MHALGRMTPHMDSKKKKKKKIFLIKYNDGKSKEWRRKIIKDIRNLLRLKKEQNDTAIKYIRIFFRVKKEIKRIKDFLSIFYIFSIIENLFVYEKDEENYFKPVSVNYFWSNNYTEITAVEKKTLSIKEYLDIFRPYIRDITNDLKQCDT